MSTHKQDTAAAQGEIGTACPDCLGGQNTFYVGDRVTECRSRAEQHDTRQG